MGAAPKRFSVELAFTLHCKNDLFCNFNNRESYQYLSCKVRTGLEFCPDLELELSLPAEAVVFSLTWFHGCPRANDLATRHLMYQTQVKPNFVQSSFIAELPPSVSVFVCVCVCGCVCAGLASSVCLHVFGGKVKARRWHMGCRCQGNWPVCSHFFFPLPLLKQNTEAPAPRW